MAGKADLLKKNVGRTSQGLFKGMEKLDSKEKNEEVEKVVTESVKTENKEPAEDIVPTNVDKVTTTKEENSKTTEKNETEVAEEKAIPVEPETKAEEVQKTEVISEATSIAESIEKEIINEPVTYEMPVQPAVTQEMPKQTFITQGNVMQDYQAQVYTQPQQYNTVPVQQPMQPQYSQVPVQPPVQQYQQLNNSNMYQQPVQPSMMQQPVYMQQNMPQEYSEPKTTKRGANKQQEKASRYEKDKFLLLDIRGLRDYVEHMAKASNLSATKYIRNLIEQDMNRNMDIYLRHKELEEQLKQRR